MGASVLSAHSGYIIWNKCERPGYHVFAAFCDYESNQLSNA